MQVGIKAQGHASPYEKMCVQRHSSRRKRSYNAAEKAAETRVRHAGRREIREALALR